MTFTKTVVMYFQVKCTLKYLMQMSSQNDWLNSPHINLRSVNWLNGCLFVDVASHMLKCSLVWLDWSGRFVLWTSVLHQTLFLSSSSCCDWITIITRRQSVSALNGQHSILKWFISVALFTSKMDPCAPCLHDSRVQCVAIMLFFFDLTFYVVSSVAVFDM